MKKAKVGSTPVVTAAKGDGYTMLFRKLKTYGPWSANREPYPYPELGANFIEDGELLRWGDELDEDPDFCPFGPEIADIEISAGQCSGVRTPDGKFHGCTFCYKNNSPREELQNMDFETYKKVLDKLTQGPLHMVIVTTSDGTQKQLDPDQAIQLTNNTTKLARDLQEGDDIKDTQ